MGGGFYGLGRLTRSEYLVIEKELRDFLDERFGQDLYRIPRYYGSKPDFGDVDILLSKKILEQEDSWDSIQQEIVESLGITQHKKNGPNFWSTVYRNFQVDFSPVSHKNLDAQANFMAFNDLGNIIGRMFVPFGLKYGNSGLSYVFRREDVGPNQPSSYKREILVSQDWKLILSFVGLDYVPWKIGFDTLDEMFDWVLTSPYFRSSSYLDPRSSIMKSRIRQRTTMQKFLEYLEKHNIGPYDRNPPERRPGRDAYIVEIEQHFGGGGDDELDELDLQGFVERERQKAQDATIVSAKLNGRLVMGWIPNCKGKALGHFLRSLHDDITNAELIQMSPLEVEEEVRKRYEKMVASGELS